MKSILAILFSVVLTALGIAIVAFNLHALTTPLLIASGACITLAMALAIPAKLENALVIVAPYLPDSLVGGRRKTDPKLSGPSALSPEASDRLGGHDAGQ